jgi:hypothetical protein
MEYIAGHVHSKLQQEHYYEIVNSMFIIVLKDGNRHSDLNTSVDYDNLTDTIELFENDIICVKYFKLNEYSSVSYSYIETINNKPIKSESLISRDFITSNEIVFNDITFAMKRDKLIDSILC